MNKTNAPSAMDKDLNKKTLSETNLKGLTQKQQEILAFIKNFIRSHNYSPSYREIMQHFHFASIASVSKHLNVLIRKGALTSEKQRSRSLLPITSAVASASSEIELPFLGYISAKTPIELFPQTQTINIPRSLIRSPETTYILKAKDDSFYSEMVVDGDLLLVEARSQAVEGDTIVASTSRYNTFIKRYHSEGHYVKLSGRSLQQSPLIIRYDELNIHGILIGLLRTYPSKT